MRGLLEERSLALGLIVALVIIVILFYWGWNVKTVQAQISYRTILLMHCGDWQDMQCESAAAESIKIDIEGEGEVEFSVLCAREYDKRNTPPQWQPYGYEGCKELCMGCPR